MEAHAEPQPTRGQHIYIISIFLFLFAYLFLLMYRIIVCSLHLFKIQREFGLMPSVVTVGMTAVLVT